MVLPALPASSASRRAQPGLWQEMLIDGNALVRQWLNKRGFAGESGVGLVSAVESMSFDDEANQLRIRREIKRRLAVVGGRSGARMSRLPGRAVGDLLIQALQCPVEPPRQGDPELIGKQLPPVVQQGSARSNRQVFAVASKDLVEAVQSVEAIVDQGGEIVPLRPGGFLGFLIGFVDGDECRPALHALFERFQGAEGFRP